MPRSASLAWGRGASWARKSVRSLKNCLSPKLHIVNVAEAKKLFITWLHPLDRADDRSHKGILTPQQYRNYSHKDNGFTCVFT